MTEYSLNLIAALGQAEVDLEPAHPHLLLGADDVGRVRQRARSLPGVVDTLAEEARQAAGEEVLFGPKPEIPYLAMAPLRALGSAALVLGDEAAAARAREGVEILFESPPEEWVARPHRPMHCDHAMLNVAARVAITTDLCAGYWSPDDRAAVVERLREWALVRFLETWRQQDAHWAEPEYHWNWKIMCCGEAGLAALGCGAACPEMGAVLEASLAGVLDVLDFLSPEGDWPEGPGYWLATLGYGLRFGRALQRATDGAVDLLSHPQLDTTGDYIAHVTEPDGGVYDYNDNRPRLGTELDYLSLLATARGRGDWARTARASERVTLERLAWDDPELASDAPAEGTTEQVFPWTGLATLRSSWNEDATFVGVKCGPSDVGHSHLDAGSFVVSARGQRLLVDEGLWVYCHFEGFFDLERRFNFDGNATVGHNTILVDGQGQVHGEAGGLEVSDLCVEGETTRITADATAAYGGRLSGFRRTVALAKPDVVLVHDEVSAEEPRQIEWLFHHRGAAEGDDGLTVIRRGGVAMHLRRLLPESNECWRTNDVNSTSAYTNSNTGAPVRMVSRYRGMGPFHPCERIEALWAIYVGNGPEPEYEVTPSGGNLAVVIRQEKTARSVTLPRGGKG